MNKEEKKKQGKKNKASGKLFENRVREHWESKGWIVCKWGNTVSFSNSDDGKLSPQKPRWNPFTRSLSYAGTGVPDFIAYKRDDGEQIFLSDIDNKDVWAYDVIGIEAKSQGLLDQNEKRIFNWLISRKIFNRIVVSRKGRKKGERKGELINQVYIPEGEVE